MLRLSQAWVMRSESRKGSHFLKQFRAAVTRSVVDIVVTARMRLLDLCVQVAWWVEGLSCHALKSITAFVQRPHFPRAAPGQQVSAEGIQRQTLSWETQGSPDKSRWLKDSLVVLLNGLCIKSNTLSFALLSSSLPFTCVKVPAPSPPSSQAFPLMNLLHV